MTEDRFIQLLQGFQDRKLSEEELHVFLEAAGDPHFESLIGEHLYTELTNIRSIAMHDEGRADKVWHNIQASMHVAGSGQGDAGIDYNNSTLVRRIPFYKRSWVRYAAAVAILCLAGYFLWQPGKDSRQEPIVNTDIAPGRDGAILTLADGSTVILDSMVDGIVAEQQGTRVLLNEGRLAYDAGNASSVTFNTMTTPRGRQFSVQLPDGTRAWLNAASSITYPTAFIGDKRKVKITGEVYFEVVKDAKRPFTVQVNDNTDIQVLGTSFNVKAYPDEAAISTTLLEGAVRLNAFDRIQLLQPGQQTLVNPEGKIQLVKNADIQKIMAWKNGLFNFQDESLEEVMKQLERWYDIKVQYIGDPPKQSFFGELGMDLTLSQVIETLREVGIRFSIEGRVLIVRP